MKIPPEKGEAYYHAMSRTVNGDWLFGDVEKETLRRHIWQVADYCGIQLITYAVMSNHFHVVVRVPKKEPLCDRELLRRYAILHSGISAWQQMKLAALERMLAADGADAQAWRERQMAMMGDLSPYLQLLKQRFSIWFNRTHNRFGTLWAERYKSVLLAPGLAVRATAAYVDLNPVRAGLVKDPKDYRFCGYAQAVAGDQRARRGIGLVADGGNWTAVQADYRVLLFRRATLERSSGVMRPTSEFEQVQSVQGALSLVEYVQCRRRYLTDGAVLGTKAFVLASLAEYRARTGRGQRTEAREVPDLEGKLGLVVMRKLA